MILILGDRNSGKSLWAEQKARQSGRRLHYLATMKPYGGEGEERVRRHREQRAADGYTTLERYGSLADLSFGSSDLVLVEDVSNFLANLLFAEKIAPDKAIAQATAELLALAAKGAEVILVSLSCAAENEFDAETIGFIKALDELNRRLHEAAVEVIEVRAGSPEYLKRPADLSGLSAGRMKDKA